MTTNQRYCKAMDLTGFTAWMRGHGLQATTMSSYRSGVRRILEMAGCGEMTIAEVIDSPPSVEQMASVNAALTVVERRTLGGSWRAFTSWLTVVHNVDVVNPLVVERSRRARLPTA